MPADISAYIGAAKQIWTSDRLEEQLYQETPTLSEIEKTDRFSIGKEAVTPLHVSRNGGYTALADNESVLNAAGNQGQAQAKWNYTNHFQQIKILHSAFVGTKGNDKAVVNAVDNEIKLGVADLRHQLEAELFMPGNASRAGTGVTTAANVIVLDATTGARALANEWLFVGAKVDIGTLANPQSRAAARNVTAVDPVANTITVDGAAVTTAAGEFVFYAGSGTGGVNREITSLLQLVSTTGAFGGLNPSTTPAWRAAVVDSTSTSVSIANLVALRTSTMRAMGGKPDLLIVPPEQMAKIYLLAQTQVRYKSDGDIDFGNVDSLSFAGYKVVEDPRAPAAVILALNSKHLFMVREEAPYWLTEVDGGPNIQWIPGEAAWGSVVGYHVNLATDARNAHAAMTALT